MNRRVLNGLVTAAVTGMMAGVPLVVGCSSDHGSASSTAGSDKHACKGMNGCKGQGNCKSGDAGCAGKNS